jgi:molecular chaperone DnaK
VADPIVGIDLGTTNSVVAACDASGAPRVLADATGVKIHPSVVSFHPNGSVIVGVEGKQRRIIDPRNTVYSAKRLIGRPFRSREIQAAQARMPYLLKEGQNQQPVIITRGGEFAVPEISAIILDHVRNAAATALGEEVTRAVVTVPASFNDAQRSATATAGAIAGITVARVLNEPTAAALAYGYQRQLSRMIAVYDFGGGTFDVTVLRLQDQVYEVLGTAGDTFLGGDDIDEALMQHMADAFLTKHRIDLRDNEIAIMRLRAVAEQTKIELSRRTRAIVKVDEAAYGPGGVPINLEIEIHRDELVNKARPIIERSFTVCEEAMRLAGVQPGAIDDIVLVGGTTKIPAVRERVTQFFQRAPRTDVNAEEAVALGAALQASALDRVLTRRQTGRTTLMPPPGPPPVTARSSVPPPPASSAPTMIGAAQPDPTAIAPSAQRTTAPLGASPMRPPGAPTSTGFEAATTVGPPQVPAIPPPRARSPLVPGVLPPVPAIPPPPGRGKTMLGIPTQHGEEITEVKRAPTAPRLAPDPSADLPIDALFEALEAPTVPIGSRPASAPIVPAFAAPVAPPSVPAFVAPPTTAAIELEAPTLGPAGTTTPLATIDPFAPEQQPTMTFAQPDTTTDGLGLPRFVPRASEAPPTPAWATPPTPPPPRPRSEPPIAPPRARTEPPVPSSRMRSEPPAPPPRPRSEPPVPAPPGSLDSLFEPPAPRPRRGSTPTDPPIGRPLGPSAATLFDQPAVPLSPAMFDAPPPPRPVAPEPPSPAAMPTLISGLAAQSVAVAAPPPALPVVLDVTPRSLGIGTVAGFCEELIRRNARVPTETRRMFTTSRDQQQTVRIRVCTGESRRIDDNIVLGDLVLEGLPARPRGQTKIEVIFALDASGILNVRARDAQTGQEQRATLDVLGAQSQAEVDAARERFGQLRR